MKNLILIIVFILGAFLIYTLFVSVLRTSTVRSPQTPATLAGREAREALQAECFMKVEQITEKDASQFNEFRSLSDFRLYKYRECLAERDAQ